MNKLVVSWFVVYAICVFLTSIYQGSGGIMSTTLTQALAVSDNHIHVASTSGYKSTGDMLYIENEQLRYTGVTPTTFTGVTHAINRTDAVAHNVIGTPVYTQEMGTINQASGAFVAYSDIPGGQITAQGFNLRFLLEAVPQVVRWEYPFLEGQMIYLKILLQMVGVGLTVSLVLATVGVFTKIF